MHTRLHSSLHPQPQPQPQPRQQKQEKNAVLNTPVSSVINMKCVEIRKAKPCKTNPKCEFDYKLSKCVDKGTALQTIPDNTSPKKSGKNSIKKKSKMNIIKKSKASLRRKSSKGYKNGENIRKSTKKVFSKLISSFDKIGNEAKRDSKILKNATEKLSI